MSSAKYMPMAAEGEEGAHVIASAFNRTWKVATAVLSILCFVLTVGLTIVVIRLVNTHGILEKLRMQSTTHCPDMPSIVAPLDSNPMVHSPDSTPEVTVPPVIETKREHSQNLKTDCEFPNPGSPGESFKNPPVFHPITMEELTKVTGYVRKNTDQGQGIHFFTDLALPPKKDVLKHLDEGFPQPPREAVVTIVNDQRGEAWEYIVGPLPELSYMYLNNRTTKNPHYRLNASKKSSARRVVNQAVSEIGYIFEESFDGESKCGSSCLRLSEAIGGVPYLHNSKYEWFRYYRRNNGFDLVHPVDMHIRVNKTLQNSNQWHVDGIFYGGELFTSVQEFRTAYDNGKIKVRNPATKEDFSNLKLKPPKTQNKRPPTATMPDGQRFTVDGYKVKSDDWQFSLMSRVSSGMRVYDIRFRGERIIYETGLEEFCVTYSGWGPGNAYNTLLDSPFYIGGQSYGLRAGIDCPEYATFFGVPAFLSGKTRNIPNAICVFEHNTQFPLRRHVKGYMGFVNFHSGVSNTVLVVRTVATIYNYDYILEYNFHPNGMVEFVIGSTGYLFTHAYNDKEKDFNFQIAPGVAGSVHDHFLNVKVDLDVHGTANRMEKIGIRMTDPGTDSDPFFPDVKPVPRKKLVKTLRKTEKEGIIAGHDPEPGYTVFYNDEKRDQFGNPRAYRLSHQGGAPQIYPPGVNGESAITWARHPGTVTRHRDSEERAGHPLGLKTYPPPIVFSDYVDDDEDIVDQDLVLWLTHGMTHIPHSEDLPVTHTTGLKRHWFLMPYNYFPLDASVSSKDQVHTTGEGEVNFWQSGDTCEQPKFDLKSFVSGFSG